MSKPINLFAHKWYFRLKKVPSGARALFEDYTFDSLYRKVVICYTPLKLPMFKTSPENGYRLFGVFNDYIEVLNYISMFKDEQRSFYEIIFGEFPQKPHFDIDIPADTENKENLGISIVETLLNTMSKVLKDDHKIILDPEYDFLIYDSNIEDVNAKISYHVVINNYYHNNNLEAKAFYDHLMEKMSESQNAFCIKFIDRAVYSNVQQFRLVGCQKTNSGRIKGFNENFIFNGKTYEHQYTTKDSDFLDDIVDDPQDEEFKTSRILYESLVSNTISCQYLPSYYVEPERFNGDLGEITEYHIKAAFEMMNISIEGSQHDFKFLSVEGNIINLKRLRPSDCPLCDRVHEHENPYILIAYGHVYWYCRRSGNGVKLSLGYVKILEIENEQSSNEVKTENLEELLTVSDVKKDALSKIKLPGPELIPESESKSEPSSIKIKPREKKVVDESNLILSPLKIPKPKNKISMIEAFLKEQNNKPLDASIVDFNENVPRKEKISNSFLNFDSEVPKSNSQKLLFNLF